MVGGDSSKGALPSKIPAAAASSPWQRTAVNDLIATPPRGAGDVYRRGSPAGTSVPTRRTPLGGSSSASAMLDPPFALPVLGCPPGSISSSCVPPNDLNTRRPRCVRTIHSAESDVPENRSSHAPVNPGSRNVRPSGSGRMPRTSAEPVIHARPRNSGHSRINPSVLGPKTTIQYRHRGTFRTDIIPPRPSPRIAPSIRATWPRPAVGASP